MIFWVSVLVAIPTYAVMWSSGMRPSMWQWWAMAVTVALQTSVARALR